MKKILMAFALGLSILFSSVAASKTDLPDFTEAENAVVVGTKNLKLWNTSSITTRFYLDVINKTTEEAIPLKIYTMKKAGASWEELGDITLGVPCSITEFDSEKFGRDQRNLQFYAFVPQNGKKYKITVDDDFQSYFAFTKNWLVVSVAPENPDEDLSYKENAVVINRSEFDPQNKFSDNIKFINHTGDKGFSVSMYGFNSEGFGDMKKPPKKVGLQLNGTQPPNPLSESQRIFIYGFNVESEAWNPVSAGTFADEESVDGNYHPTFYKHWGGAPMYKSFGLVFSNGKKYIVNPYLDGDDLCIELKSE